MTRKLNTLFQNVTLKINPFPNSWGHFLRLFLPFDEGDTHEACLQTLWRLFRDHQIQGEPQSKL